jgi:thiamine pyrophosphate-dependent acetolactate synthase large subunit-like protein
MKRVADLLVDTLVAAGVERVYGLAGDSLNGITDSIRPGIILSGFQCGMKKLPPSPPGAEAHLTGRLAVCAGSCGPGNLHLINGLYDAHRSRVPVLAMANALPQAIGAQLTAPGRQIVAMSGDGGISMLLGDLLTPHQLNLPVKIVVFRNDFSRLR